MHSIIIKTFSFFLIYCLISFPLQVNSLFITAKKLTINHLSFQYQLTSKQKETVSKNNFTKIDKHARNAPEYAERDVKALAKYLQQPAKNDLEKARAIYIWLTQYIYYDDEAYNSNAYLNKNYSANNVLENRNSVCEGFANLFYALGKEMGLEIKKVSGYAKGYSYKKGQRFNDTNHAWNIIRINGQGRVFDATWGEGYGKNVNGKLLSKKKFDEFWFNTDPYAAIFTHMPTQKWQTLIENPIPPKIFHLFPTAHNSYFKLGFDAKETYEQIYNNKRLRLPETYQVDMPIHFKKGPQFDYLSSKKAYSFEIEAPKAIKMAIITDKDTWHFLEKNGTSFHTNYKPVNDKSISIAVLPKNSTKYNIFIQYKVH